MTSEHQLYLGLAVVVAIAIVVFLLRKRITNIGVTTKHGGIRIDADKPEQPRADLTARKVTAKRGNANVIDEIGGTIDASEVSGGQDVTVSRKAPPK